MVGWSYLSNRELPIETAYAMVDKRGSSLEDVLYALDLIYREAERRDVKVVLQEITEVNHHLDRNGRTTIAAANLSEFMAPHTAGQ
jgi:arginase family enzyme